jgi:anti-anti-sigma factor
MPAAVRQPPALNAVRRALTRLRETAPLPAVPPARARGAAAPAHDAGSPARRPALRVVHQTVGFRRVLAVEGDIDLATVGTLRAAIASALDSWEREVWIDLSRVAFMDSTGLYALIEARRALADHGRQLVVICPSGPVRRLLALTGVDGELTVLSSRADAQRLS